ncbi:HlyD family type I secretion periplasmic adaptor subunit [Halomonas cupida]|uniref:HlyD family type I secretion periplasmic adaptor subunit n=1 Tax=Halomonas cupida TaxID=44933 RepID=UPI0039B6E205
MDGESVMARAPSDKVLSEPRLPHSRIVVWLVVAALVAFGGWAWYFQIDEVTTGSGKIVPSSNEQVVQSLEGGILKELLVKPGDIVEKGQVLAKLDPVRAESAVGESRSHLLALLASSARLTAEVSDAEPQFPEELNDHPGLIEQEMSLYRSRRSSLTETVSGLEEERRLVQQEINMTQPYVARGAATEVEVLRLRRQASELSNRIEEARNQYYVKAREELAKVMGDIESLRSVVRGRQDSLQRLEFISPVRGIVKDIEVTTAGGVIPPNGKLMSIVPLEDQLLVEARISPRDVAFIHPGQHAEVKITAYDYSIYGGLDGEVTVISPDTTQDEVRRDTWYYKVYIRTDQSWLETDDGKHHPIFPGMITTVDIATGSRTILDYLLKPFNKAREALRER